MRRKDTPPKWERQVNQTIENIKKKSKSKTLKSSNIFECICIFIFNHLKKRIFAHATISISYQQLHQFFKWLNNIKKINDVHQINTNCIREYFSYLQSQKEYKKVSIQFVYRSLSQFFQSIRRRKLIDQNPFKDFDLSVKNYLNYNKILTVFDIKILLSSVKKHYLHLKNKKSFHSYSLFTHRRDLCIISLGIACGLRRKEMLSIKIENVDFDTKTICIHGKGNQQYIVRERTIFFSHYFLEKILRKYYHLRKELPGNSFFCNLYGDELTPNAINGIFRKYLSFCFTRISSSPTITRKSFASYLVYNKVNIKAIQVLMGHKACETTLKYYVQLSTTQLKKTWEESNPYANTN